MTKLYFIFPERVQTIKYHTLIIEADSPEEAGERAKDFEIGERQPGEEKMSAMTIHTEYKDVVRAVKDGHYIAPRDIIPKKRK